MNPHSSDKIAVGFITLHGANSYVKQFHRHCQPVQGHKFSVGGYRQNAYLHNIWVKEAVAIVGRPVSRHLDDGVTWEVRRLVTVPHATRNLCSKMLALIRRVAKRAGIKRLVTYTLETESGTSLKASGWNPVATTRGGSWNSPSRPRIDKAPTTKKTRWEIELISQKNENERRLSRKLA